MLSHPILILPAVASGVLVALVTGLGEERLAGPVRVGGFAAACICIIAVILMTLVLGGSQEELVCYFLCVLACRLLAGLRGKGGGA